MAMKKIKVGNMWPFLAASRKYFAVDREGSAYKEPTSQR